MVSNRNLLFQVSIFRGYVSFREGNSPEPIITPIPAKIMDLGIWGPQNAVELFFLVKLQMVNGRDP